jgi:hypothetical protein
VGIGAEILRQYQTEYLGNGAEKKWPGDKNSIIGAGFTEPLYL